MPRLVCVCLLGLALTTTAACGGSPQPPNTPAPGGEERVSGSERVGWTQAAADRAELDTFEFLAYVDGVRNILKKVNCENGAGGAFECSAPLPAMAPGRRILELATRRGDEDDAPESARSAPLVLLVGSAVTATQTSLDQPSQWTAPDADAPVVCDQGASRCYAIEKLSDRISASPRGLTAMPDGRVWLIDGSRSLLALDGDAATPLELASPCDRDLARSRIEDVAGDPEFARTRLVFVSWRCGEARDLRLNVIRYSELQGTLAQAASVASFPVGPKLSSRLAVAAGRTLYVSIPALRETELHRLNFDGTTPDDNPRGLSTVATFQRVYAMSGLLDALYLSTSAGFAEFVRDAGGLRLRAAASSDRATSSISSLAVQVDGSVIATGDGEVVLFRATSSSLARVSSLRLPELGRLIAVARGGDGTIFVIADSAAPGARVFRLRSLPR